MMGRRTRWYQSLVFRLLALFWLLLLGAAFLALYGALYFSQPSAPEPAASDFERTLTPVFKTAQSSEILQPGRLLVGDYRVVARLRDNDREPTIMETLHPDLHATILALFLMENPQQVPVGDKMIAGPFVVDQSMLIVSRNLTSEEVEQLALAREQDWLPRVMALSVGFSGFGAFILGIWFVRPLRRLRNATREVAAGVATPKLGRLPKRRDELGELASTLQITAQDLATSRDAQRRLLSDVSHELRSPLARSNIALDLLGSEHVEVVESKHFKQLNKDIYRLGSIIDSILWLSRLENGIDEPICQTVQLDEFLEELKADLGYAHQDWTARLSLTYDLDITLLTDPVLLRLIIENLVRNAFQYGPEKGEVFLTAHLKKIANQVPSNSELEIVILDQGEGVEENKIKQLFQPFFRADASRHHGAGVGLGLALCQRAAHILQGEITALNHPDGGLQVTLTLPIS